MRVFYSWQSDLPNGTNRSFIEEALTAACADLKADGGVHAEAVVDRDTLNLPGSPKISDAIFKKIADSDAIIVDVSTINESRSSSCRPSPNPNVLVELGYALKSLGEERIIMVVNTHYGDVDLLPFDLGQYRVTKYRASPGELDRSTERRRLAKVLREALAAIRPRSPPEPALSYVGEPTRLFHAAEASAIAGKELQWQRLFRTMPEVVDSHLKEWRIAWDEKWRGNPRAQDLAPALQDAMSRVEPVIAVALGGCAAAEPFHQTPSLLTHLLTTTDWMGGGLVIQAECPRALAYVLHHLAGAALIERGRSDRVLQMLLMQPQRRRPNLPLMLDHAISSHPRTLDNNATSGWQFLWSLAETSSLVGAVFGSSTDWQYLLTEYRILLCVAEFALRIGAEPNRFGQLETERMEVTPVFIHAPRDVRLRAFSSLLSDRSFRGAVQQFLGVHLDGPESRRKWPIWLERFVAPHSSGLSRGFWSADEVLPTALPT